MMDSVSFTVPSIVTDMRSTEQLTLEEISGGSSYGSMGSMEPPLWAGATTKKY